MDREKVNELYLMPDGTQADPKDVKRDDKGVLRNKNGLAVVLDADGKPETIGRSAVSNKNVEAANAGRPAEQHIDHRREEVSLKGAAVGTDDPASFFCHLKGEMNP